MNAHINHDLPLAVVATCKEFGKNPDTPPIHADYQRVNELLAKAESEVRQSFEAKLVHLAMKDAEAFKHIVGSWSITATRDLAWNNTENAHSDCRSCGRASPPCAISVPLLPVNPGQWRFALNRPDLGSRALRAQWAQWAQPSKLAIQV